MSEVCDKVRPFQYDQLDRCADCNRHWSDHDRFYLPKEMHALRADLARERTLREEAKAKVRGRWQTIEDARLEGEMRIQRYWAPKMRTLHRRAQSAESRAIKAERQAEALRKRADSERAERHAVAALLGCSPHEISAFLRDPMRDPIAPPAMERPIPEPALVARDGGARMLDHVAIASVLPTDAEYETRIDRMLAEQTATTKRPLSQRNAVVIEGPLPHRSDTACAICDEDPCERGCEIEAAARRAVMERAEPTEEEEANADWECTKCVIQSMQKGEATIREIGRVLACSPDQVVEAAKMLVMAHEKRVRSMEGQIERTVEHAEANERARAWQQARAERAEAERDALKKRAEGAARYAEAVALNTDASRHERAVAMSVLELLREA